MMELGFVTIGGFELLILVLDFLEQAHVLDGDHRLVCEGLEESDLLIRERSHLRSADKNRPDWNALAQQWRGKQGANTPLYSSGAGIRKVVAGCGEVMDVNGLPVDHGSTAYYLPADRPRLAGRQ